MKIKQTCITVFVAYLTIQIATRSTSLGITTVIHAWTYGRFIEIQSNLRRKKFTEQIKASIFLEAVLAIEIT